jgi:hypothetical protein
MHKELSRLADEISFLSQHPVSESRKMLWAARIRCALAQAAVDAEMAAATEERPPDVVVEN